MTNYQKPKRTLSALAAKPKRPPLNMLKVIKYAIGGVVAAWLLFCGLAVVASLILAFGKAWGIGNGGAAFMLVAAWGVPFVGAIIGAWLGARRERPNDSGEG